MPSFAIAAVSRLTRLWTGPQARKSRRLLGRASGLMLLLSATAVSADAATTYRARSIAGEQAPPSYGLRLDGFYDSLATTEVTFHFDEVYFDRYDDGTALLRGEITVAEFNDQDAPDGQNLGPGPHAGERFLLNVHFVQITDPDVLALNHTYRSDWSYYDIDPAGVEMQRIGVSSDSTHLWMYPATFEMPFQVGPGANEKNQLFGAAGWLSFLHYKDGQVHGGGPGTYLNASDFLMDLEPMEPEPCDSVRTIDNFTMRFLGVQYNYAAGTSRWDYELTWDGSPPELSQLTFELCKELTNDNLVSATPSNGRIGKDGSTGLWGIKWDPPPHMPPGTPVRFSFTLDRLLDVDNAGFFPKAAINCNYAQICGPALDCRELTAPCTDNQPPFVLAPPVPAPFACVPENGIICIPGWTFGDPDGDELTFGTMGSGTFDPATGTFCKPVGAPGQYTMMLAVSDSCGGTATTSLTFELLPNDPPVVTLPSDSLFICQADTICIDFTVTDEEPGSVELHTNLGFISEGRFCFVADTSGEYIAIVTAIDACGLTGADTSRIVITVNQPPSIAIVLPGQRSLAAGGPPVLITTRCDETVSICEGDSLVCLESRLFVADGDAGDSIVITLPDGVIWNSDNGILCLSDPLPGEHLLVFTATDTCGATSAETLLVAVEAGVPPQLFFSSPDTTLYLCDPDTSLCFTVLATGSEPLEIEEVLSPGSYNAATGVFCFNPDSVCFDNPGTVDTTICIVFRATNDCGSTVDSLCITVATKRPPVVTMPADTAFAPCEWGELCVGPVIVNDPSGSPLSISGVGAIYRDGYLCFTPSEEGVYYLGVEVSDTCGHSVVDSVRVDVRLNAPPAISGPTSDSVGICDNPRVCVGPYLIADPDGDPISVSVSGGAFFDPVSLSGGLCFEAQETGDYTFIITASDSCGSTTQSVTVHVQANAPPVWTLVPDTTVMNCEVGDSICFSFAAADPDGDSLCYALTPIPDTPLGTAECEPNAYCFVPSESGTYRFLVAANDGCHESLLDTVIVQVNVNTPPQLMFSLPDTTIYVCDADTVICFNVGAMDVDGDSVVLREILNPGSFDLETGRVCFNPDSICFDDAMTMDTTICLIFGVSDACGPEVVDSLCITIQLNRAPMVRLPIGQTVNVCAPGPVCLPGAMVFDPDGDPLQIDLTPGASYEGGQICFYASEPGSYKIGLCATDPCGLSACDTIEVQVRMNSTPTVTLGSDRFVSLCAAGVVCVDAPLIGDADGDIPRLEFEGATQQGEDLCFMATGPEVRTIVVRAIDSCGAVGADTMRVTVAMNTAPRVLIRTARPLTLCDIDTTLCYPVTVSDLGSPSAPTITLIKTDTRFWTWTGQSLCLDASVAMAGRTEGTFQAIVEATDACGAKGRDTLLVHLKANQAPHAQLPGDSSVVLCEAGEVCIGPLSFGDPDQTALDVQVTGGTLSGDQICFDATHDTAVVLVLTVSDSCGLMAIDTMRVNVRINREPVVVLPDFNTLNVCALDTVCVDGIEGLDPDTGRLPAELVSGPGSFDPETGRLCFVPTQSGPYEFTFQTHDGCATVTAEWSVEVIANRAPAFVASPELSEFRCLPGDTVCLSFSAIDPEGDPLTYRLVSGAGQIDGATGRLCFTPAESGLYEFVVSASDSCGAAVLDTGHAAVQINRPPALQFSSNDTSLYLCDPDTLLCWTVAATDPDGGAVEIVEVLNPGEFNPLTGVFCFNPDSVCFDDPLTQDTTVCIVFAATDSCGARTVDSFCVQLSRNRAPVVDLGPDRPVLLCEAGALCLTLSGLATDPDGDLLVLNAEAPAYLSHESLCVEISSAGIQRVVLCATDPCGLTTCDTLYLEVTLNSAPQVVLPPDTTVVACVLDQVCVGPVMVSDPDIQDHPEVTVTGGATIIGNELCFQPTGNGLYTFTVTATDLCGASDVDSISVRVETNDPPQLVFSSPDTSITVCKSDTELCFSVTAVDPDGESLEIEEVLVPGFFDPSTGIFCFNPDSVCFQSPLTMDTTICVVFRVTDGCGATTTDSLCVEVRVNRPPELHFSVPDTTLYLCRLDTLLCFGVTATDAEGDAVVIREILNPGEYYPELGLFCFEPQNVCYPNLPCSAPPTCIVFEAEDACGNVTRDSLCLDLYANVKPVVVAPDSVRALACEAGDEVCVSPVYAQDIEDGTLLVSAPGATYDPRLQTLCFIADTSGTYRLEVTAVDGCGARDTATVTVRVDANQAPVVLVPGDTALLLCGPDTVCFPVAVTDPDNAWTVTQVLGPAYFDQANSRLCVYFDGTGGPIVAGLLVTDACGATASGQFQIQSTVNTAPRVTLPADFATKLCQPGPYCFGPVTIVDSDFNLAGPPQVTGGTYHPDSGTICFDVTSSGPHTVIVSATDSCGLGDVDTITVNATLNRAPVTRFSSPDTSLFLCTADTVLCFTFSAQDPDGDLVLLNEILNPGVFDPLTGEFCFNPSEVCFNNSDDYDTTFCLIFSATDSCGLEVRDTLCLQVTANGAPVVVAPQDTSVSACNGDSICLNSFVVTDPNGAKDQLSVTSSGPAHAFDPFTGRLCFVAGPGTYRFGVTATDRCGLVAGDSVTVTVTANRAPLVTLPADFGTTPCADSEICIPVTATDPDANDVLIVTAISPLARYDEATSRICLAPETSGVYLVIAQATDVCGLEDRDTVRVTVTMNRAPFWVSVPMIDSFFCAPPGPVCFSVRAQDPDGQPIIYIKREGPGTIDSATGLICFNPGTTPGRYNFVVTACDPCGLVVNDTASVLVRFNRPPSFTAVRDTLVAQCQPTQICFPPLAAPDPDGGPVTYSLLSGSGSLTGSTYCFTPDTTGLYRISVKATDACASADTVVFFASVRLNRPPVLNLPAPSTRFQCQAAEICIGGISASDPDGGPITVTKFAGPGTFNQATGQLCFTPTGSGTTHFDFRATDTCGAQVTGRVSVTVLLNRPPTLDVPDRIAGCRDSLICIPVSGLDPDIGTRLTITQLSGPSGAFSPNPLTGPAPLSGQWCWRAPAAGSYQVVFQVSDSCGSVATDTTRIDVSDYCDTLCFATSIPNICPDSAHPDRWLFQGMSHQFPVMVTPSRAVGAFDFLIGYDASAMTLQKVERGADISAWEYFTYRIVDPDLECSGLCPSGLLRIVGIADMNNGKPIADPTQTQPSAQPREYARITFLASNDRTLGGQFVPVEFWWNDCGDNTFSSPLGDLYVSNTIDPDTCVGGGAKEPIEACATFQDGGGCIPTASDIDDRGDLNLNGIGYEIADAVLYSNYFIFGPQVFDPDPVRNASQVAASDVNADGSALTVADLVFLIRIILELEQPIVDGASRIAPAGNASLHWVYEGDEANLVLESPVATGALALEAQLEGRPTEVLLCGRAQAAGMELKWHFEADRLKILVYSMSGVSMDPGSAAVVTVRGAYRPESIRAEASDEQGKVVQVALKSAPTLPQAFDLDWNFPNPFNPETEIRFTLHRAATVDLTIYNVLGQPVTRLVERLSLSAGPYQYRWLAKDERGVSLPSGVYMYRLTADGYSETRKMLLVR